MILDLMLDSVAIDVAGDPLLLAAVCAEAARRAGLAIGIAHGPRGALLAVV